MGDLGERERGLFRDWATRKMWVPGDKKDAPGPAATEPPPEAEAEPESTAPAAPNGAASMASPAEPTLEAAAAPTPPEPAASFTQPAPPPAAPVPVYRTAQPPPEPPSGPPRLSHVNERGEARMVDVTEKADTDRIAVAEGYVAMQPSTLALILGGALAKGDVLAVARVAGVMAAKRTSDLIPMCHPLPITGVTVDIWPSGESRLQIQATVRTTGKTGVEMEALTAVGIAALTVYDMAKAVDRGMRIEGIRLLEKSGGKSDDWSAR